jgi:hypothetical protein
MSYERVPISMIRKFIETKAFESLISQIRDKDLERQIKNAILQNPEVGDLISGTGGLRKFRVADKKSSKGKSGSYRVLFLDLPKYEVTYLILIFPKTIVANINASLKAQLKKNVTEIKNGLSKK